MLLLVRDSIEIQSDWNCDQIRYVCFHSIYDIKSVVDLWCCISYCTGSPGVIVSYCITKYINRLCFKVYISVAHRLVRWTDWIWTVYLTITAKLAPLLTPLRSLNEVFSIMCQQTTADSTHVTTFLPNERACDIRNVVSRWVGVWNLSHRWQSNSMKVNIPNDPWIWQNGELWSPRSSSHTFASPIYIFQLDYTIMCHSLFFVDTREAKSRPYYAVIITRQHIICPSLLNSVIKLYFCGIS